MIKKFLSSNVKMYVVQICLLCLIVFNYNEKLIMQTKLEAELAAVQYVADQAYSAASIDARIIRIVEILGEQGYDKLAPSEKTLLAKTIVEQATMYGNMGVTPTLLMAVIEQESNFDPRAKSQFAYGLMQLTPATALPYLREMGYSGWTEEILFDIKNNIEIGTKYLVDLHSTYIEIGLEDKDNWVYSIHSYFWGPGNTALLYSGSVDARYELPSLTYSAEVTKRISQFKDIGVIN